jgi:alkylation response protein AidB-like acyl-CoA dehydrogenase
MTVDQSTDLDRFRADAAAFLQSAIDADEHCPAFGAIMPPAMHDRARAWQRRMYDGGFAGLHWPVEFGGRGLTRAHTAVWSEECARLQVQSYMNLQGLILAAEAILRHGTPDQQQRFLLPTVTGEMLWCQLFSEPNAGSDLAGLQTSAVRDGDRYIVNGQKVWTSNGQHAEYAILMARTNPDEPSHRGISFFLIDMSLPGIDVRPLTQMTGDQEFCEVFLTDVEMPADALLGPEHGGWLVAMEVLLDERGSAGAAGTIALERRLGELAANAGEGPVGDQVMELVVRGHSLKAMLQRADADPSLASASKLARTELDFDAEMVQAALRGAEGMLAGEATERLLYAPGMKVAGGTSEIQRNIIAERILGLPRT